MENWRFIEGAEDYMVSDKGRVLSLKGKEKRMLKADIDHCGYECVCLCMKGLMIRHKVHRLVAKSFLFNARNLPEVNHLDGNKLNNGVTNLEWCDHYDNVQHALLHGLFNSKLKPCGVVNERGEVTRRYRSMSQLCKTEGLDARVLGTQFRMPGIFKKQYNVVLL
ncbi:NUMOD4 domain-containing protein [uncultured Bacteroides sp.]|uniref:NUMOD4 domain-containing protein n=1 Tax=uncultured Bacteroides sp. TaxID=162156 RepID=UPI002AA63BF2|nr:NUMOD4 domain-containing protein [uncultured Bacteroides sp.]